MKSSSELVKLLKSNHFCVLPWVGMTVDTNGDVSPCCVTRSYVFGSLKSNTAEEIFNSSKANEFRKMMLEGPLPKNCSVCKREESLGTLSFREDSNKRYRNLFLDSKVPSDGSIKDYHLGFIDFRFSNLCNFKCIMCGPTDSTAWSADAAKLGHAEVGLTKAFTSVSEAFELVDSHLKTLELIHFAGGEPLLSKEHDEILKHLVNTGSTNIALRYNTNLSMLRKKNIDYISLWSQFKSVTINASIDGSGAMGEFIRKGSNWKEIKKNLLRLKSVEGVEVKICCTLQVLNALNIPDLHKELVDQGTINPWTCFYYNILTTPEYFSIQVLPPKVKEQVIKKWKNYKEWLEVVSPENFALTQIDSTMGFMLKSDKSILSKQLEAKIAKFSQAWKKNYFKDMDELIKYGLFDQAEVNL